MINDLILADSNQKIANQSYWTTNPLRLVVSLPNILSQKALATLYSGFATISQLKLSYLLPAQQQKTYTDQHSANKPQPLLLHTTTCSTQYDLWDETFNIVIIAPKKIQLIADSFPQYVSACLSTIITNKFHLDLLKQGGIINASIVIEQVSPAEANKVKNWLVKQQSNLVQELFSHLLTDFTYFLSSNIAIRVPRYEKGEQ